jgi:hypothetical protein
VCQCVTVSVCGISVSQCLSISVSQHFSISVSQYLSISVSQYLTILLSLQRYQSEKDTYYQRMNGRFNCRYCTPGQSSSRARSNLTSPMMPSVSDKQLHDTDYSTVLQNPESRAQSPDYFVQSNSHPHRPPGPLSRHPRLAELPSHTPAQPLTVQPCSFQSHPRTQNVEAQSNYAFRQNHYVHPPHPSRRVLLCQATTAPRGEMQVAFGSTVYRYCSSYYLCPRTAFFLSTN